MAFLYALSFMLGLIIGSFLNVCIYRIPRGGSIVSPPSSCPACGTRIKAYHNIPVISWLALRGRCAACGCRISPIYPAVELLNALLYLAALYRFGPTAQCVLVMALLSTFIVVTFIDLEHRIIPDGITLPGIILGLALGPLVMKTAVLDSILGIVAGGGLLYGVGVLGSLFLRKDGMGGGDVKLMAMIGGFLGWKMVLVSIFIGSLLGSLVGVPLIVFKVMSRDSQIPFGPFLAAGAAIAIFFGNQVVGWYGGVGVWP